MQRFLTREIISAVVISHWLHLFSSWCRQGKRVERTWGHQSSRGNVQGPPLRREKGQKKLSGKSGTLIMTSTALLTFSRAGVYYSYVIQMYWITGSKMTARWNRADQGKCHVVENMLWETIFVKEFHGSIESGQGKRNAILKTEEPGMALPVHRSVMLSL